MTLTYRWDQKVTPDEYMSLCERSGLRRPQEPKRVGRMLEHANLWLTVWDGERLVGLARGLTDYGFDCYLSDLMVDESCQGQGIGRTMIEQIKERLGEEVMFLLVAARKAVDFYAKTGFAPAEGAYWILNKS